MNGLAFKAWREAAGLTQAEAADLAKVSRPTVARAEAAGGKPVPGKLASIAAPALTDDTLKTPAAVQKALKADRARELAKASPGLAEAMKRNPPFAKTAAEAKAMRQLRAEQKGVDVANIRLLPLRPDWRVLEGGRSVNAAIPDPVNDPAPPWAGDRGVLTRSGAVYDYEAAHRMHPPRQLNAANVTAGDW